MKLVVSEFVSLDGVMEDPGGAEAYEHGGWTFTFDRGREGDQFKLDELTAADALLLGRTTYEGFAKAWPSIPDDEAGFSQRMNSMRKYVVSSTLERADWNNSTVVGFDDIATLKEQPGGDLLVAGSAQLVQGLTDAGLVDELRLIVFPVLLGSGKRLYDDDTGMTRFELVEAKPSGQVVLMTLRRVASA